MKWSLNVICLLAGLVLGFTALLPVAHAELIGVAQLVTPAETDRDDVSAASTIMRLDVVNQMQAAGIAPKQAQARVAAMSDQEIRIRADRPAPLPSAADAWSDSEMAMPVLLATALLALALLLVAFDGTPRQSAATRDSRTFPRMPHLAANADNWILK